MLVFPCLFIISALSNVNYELCDFAQMHKLEKCQTFKGLKTKIKYKNEGINGIYLVGPVQFCILFRGHCLSKLCQTSFSMFFLSKRQLYSKHQLLYKKTNIEECVVLIKS